MFMKDKMFILTVKSRVEEMKKEYFTPPCDGEFFDIPLAILVNIGSASAEQCRINSREQWVWKGKPSVCCALGLMVWL